ncbi:MAG: heparinase II/III family protein, partial [Candidatus Latescibacteria bacterium]|nr:heparinase II/III family protein [Candidatus Latescibacterota bacterium]
ELVTGGGGFAPWQDKESPSRDEIEFREGVEARKTELLGSRSAVEHPAMWSDGDVELCRKNIENVPKAQEWYQGLSVAEYVANQPDNYVDEMISLVTPGSSYSFSCPNCIGVRTHEGASESGIISWDWREPDTMSCRVCGQRYPDDGYPETGVLQCPRMDQTFCYYLNDDERQNPNDRSGRLSYKWGRHPVHVSFSGIIRSRKQTFMIGVLSRAATLYRLTGKPHHAATARRILLRLTQAFGSWLYHDYWDTVADCDPLYAAWHDMELPLEFKRHPCSDPYGDDTRDKASMLQNYWGGGRYHASTGAISTLQTICEAYDAVHDAQDDDSRPIWSGDERNCVERDLILEWAMEAEPYIGGPGEADCVNNKSPRIYSAMAAVAKCLGLPLYADVAIRGYAAIRDSSFNYDGFSTESPAYTMMYLGGLLDVPETLHGYRWPVETPGRSGVVDLFGDDPMLSQMIEAVVDCRRADGRLVPLSDTREILPTDLGASTVLEIGFKRFPELLGQRISLIYSQAGLGVTSYGMTHLDASSLANSNADQSQLPELYFPAWMTPILRHGSGKNASMAALPFNPPGGHRHPDNLGLYYVDRGRTILGDMGYLSSSPSQRWIRSTASHNLVIVDGQEQSESGEIGRKPSLNMMVTSPSISVVEGSSTCYPQCSEYRRLIALIKGPDDTTVMVDIFRVAGGRNHDWRVFSELASSDANNGSLEFEDIRIPDQAPLPDFEASMEDEHVFGLRDFRSTVDTAGGWRAVWKQSDRKNRLWMLTLADEVVVSNGPGQERFEAPGRRVRYVDVIRRGEGAKSSFVAVHEPDGPDGRFPITDIELLDLPTDAGELAVALRIESSWGRYWLFSDVDSAVEVERIKFQGKFGVLCEPNDGGRWLMSSGARTLRKAEFGFTDAVIGWSAGVADQDGGRLVAESS